MPRNSLVPEGAWDTHTHVFDPDRFPYSIPRSYTPKSAQISEYPSDAIGCTKIVVVHASIQGSSPAALIDTLSKAQECGLTLRGLATIDIENTTDDELEKLHLAGVRGARLHEMSWGHGHQAGGSQIGQKVQALADRFKRFGWAIGVFCDVRGMISGSYQVSIVSDLMMLIEILAWASMAGMIRTMDPRVKIIADHFGGTFPGEENTPEFRTFLELVKEKRLWVKVSGFERLYHGHGTGRDGMEAIKPIIQSVIEAGPDQIIFGSDWPHTQLGVTRKGKTDQQRLDEIEGFRDVPDDIHIQVLRDWITDDEVWQKLFVTNAERLFN
jgi:predicted TIM-barrel fold metal-dependent hydrolase